MLKSRFIVLFFVSSIVYADTTNTLPRVISLVMNAGMSPSNFSVGSTYKSSSLGFGLTVRPQVDLILPTMYINLGFYFHGIFGSSYGSIPLAELGTCVTYFPYGHPQQRTIVDNQVVILTQRVVPYLQLSTGIASFSINDKALSTSFNAILFDVMIFAGVRFPLTDIWNLGIQVGYQFTIGGKDRLSSSGDGTTLPAVSMSGLPILVNVAYTPY